MNNEMMLPESRATEEIKNSSPTPVFEMREGEIMPIFLFVSKLAFMGSAANLLIAIQYRFVEQTIEIRGRMRFEDTGRKTVFSKPQKATYCPWNYEAMKREIKDMNAGLSQLAHFDQLEPPIEFEFAIGENFESIVQKLDASGEFDINRKDKKDQSQP